MKQVSIEFAGQPTSQDKSPCQLNWLAWTYRNKDAKHILINKIFEDRLELISEDNEDNNYEREVILLMISFLIIHEMGHLFTRWNGQIDSPDLFGTYSKAPEAGYYLEKNLFYSVVRLVVSNDAVHDPFKWNEETKIKGISVRKQVNGELKEVKLQQSFIHQIVKKFDSLPEEQILPLQYNMFDQINQNTELTLNAGDCDFEEVDYDVECKTDFADNEYILKARCGSISK
jgi:hypothetical protein